MKNKTPLFEVNAGHVCIFCSGTGKTIDSTIVNESYGKRKRCKACSGKGWFGRPKRIIVKVTFGK